MGAPTLPRPEPSRMIRGEQSSPAPHTSFPPPDRPAPFEIRVGGAAVGPGSRVRLRPGTRRSDAQDMFLAGMTATVEAVLRDVDHNDCVAVTLDDDPGSEILRWQRRFLYFYPDEIEPLDPAEAPAP